MSACVVWEKNVPFVSYLCVLFVVVRNKSSRLYSSLAGWKGVNDVDHL